MQLPFFYEPDIQQNHHEFELSEATARHCLQVLRMKKGEALLLTDGKGNLFTSVIKNDNKKHCVVSITKTEMHNALQPFICIAIAPVKNASRLEWFVEKATEIGINKIVLLQTKRTEKINFKQERLLSIMASAMFQSQQVWLPELVTDEFSSFIANNKSEVQLIAHCLNTGNKQTLSSFNSFQSATILIGPEGDFTEEEIELALNKNYQPVSLGKTRLRTETAGVLAAAVLRSSQ